MLRLKKVCVADHLESCLVHVHGSGKLAVVRQVEILLWTDFGLDHSSAAALAAALVAAAAQLLEICEKYPILGCLRISGFVPFRH